MIVHEIQGREVKLPCVVRHASAGSATFLVPSRAAQRLLPSDDFRVAEVLPGRGLLSVAIIDYKENDLGDYNEVSVALFVRPRGAPTGLPWLGAAVDMARGRLGTFILHLPVDQGFTCEAGCRIWGFPKTVQRIDFDYGQSRVRCRLDFDGEHALGLALPRGGSRRIPERSMSGYTLIEGVPHRVPFTSGAEGFGVQLGGAELELGSGPIADELRGLGLPRRALMTTWMERMYGTFAPAEKL
jgi:hypothetical protein